MANLVSRSQFRINEIKLPHVSKVLNRVSEDGVDPESDTETFIAMKCGIDNWRWAGVPFYLRHGKRLSKGAAEIAIQFKAPPAVLFAEACGLPKYSTLKGAPSACRNRSRGLVLR